MGRTLGELDHVLVFALEGERVFVEDSSFGRHCDLLSRALCLPLGFSGGASISTIKLDSAKR